MRTLPASASKGGNLLAGKSQRGGPALGQRVRRAPPSSYSKVSTVVGGMRDTKNLQVGEGGMVLDLLHGWALRGIERKHLQTLSAGVNHRHRMHILALESRSRIIRSMCSPKTRGCVVMSLYTSSTSRCLLWIPNGNYTIDQRGCKA